MPFTFQRMEIPDLILITPQAFTDARGFFVESYKQSEFQKNGINDTFVQDNHSQSGPGVIRGLHYQLPPHAQSKLVRCTHGEIIDVAVDIRKSSPTFGKWIKVHLSAENKQMLYIPAGFAHGFCTLSEADVLYKTSDEFAPECERGILWSDPDLDISWPDGEKAVSEKDRGYPSLKDAEIFPS